jgi:hypothetical protein
MRVCSFSGTIDNEPDEWASHCKEVIIEITLRLDDCFCQLFVTCASGYNRMSQPEGNAYFMKLGHSIVLLCGLES